MPVDRRSRRQRARLGADDAAEIRAGRGEVGFGGELLGAAGSELRFGLRDVGAGHLADVEAVAGLFQRLLEHVQLLAHHVHAASRRGA